MVEAEEERINARKAAIKAKQHENEAEKKDIKASSKSST
jgi:hypothetical protein